jgi:hypothetical protein
MVRTFTVDALKDFPGGVHRSDGKSAVIPAKSGIQAVEHF